MDVNKRQAFAQGKKKEIKKNHPRYKKKPITKYCKLLRFFVLKILPK
jgi:hypothetical protein